MKNTRKPSKLRAIDQGTRYDITGNLRRLTRAIERGDYGKVSHVMVGVKAFDLKGPDQRPGYTTLGFGANSTQDMAYTVDMMKKRVVGSSE